MTSPTALSALLTKLRATQSQATLADIETALGQKTFECQLEHALSLSPFVAQVLQKQPQLIMLWRGCRTADVNFTQKLAATLANVQDELTLHRTLRVFRQAEMAHLSFCQSNNLMSVEQTFHALSALAECIITQTAAWLYHTLSQRYGTPMNAIGQAQPLVILGMGKLGGRELNFSSDIDLIFTYPENGETQGARRSIDNAQFFTRLGQHLIQALDSHTADGFVYRTDMRLRPFGDAGALVLNFTALEDYYQEQGRDWERYALIKARIMGENDHNAYHQQLTNMLRPFVYRRYIDFSVIQSLRNMKAMIEREVRRRALVNNIKLGAGGIREIEFIVQVFQLIRGGRDTHLQHRSLLDVLPHLVQLNVLSESEGETLRQAYLFLRRVENVLQAIDDKQTQTLPDDETNRARLVTACAQYPIQDANANRTLVTTAIHDWTSFETHLQQHQSAVRDIFNALIGEEEAVHTQAQKLSPWQDFLSFNCSDIEHVLAENALDSFDLAPSLERFQHAILRRPIGQRGREVLNRLIPVLLDGVFALSTRAAVLDSVLNIIAHIVTRTTYLELLLEYPNALNMVIRLSAASPMIAEQVAKYPILLDELLDTQTLFNPPHLSEYPTLLHQYMLRIPRDDEEQQIDALRQFKQASLLHIASADILGELPVMKVSDHLTYLAQAIIGAVVTLAWEKTRARYGVPAHLTGEDKGFLVIGYGKLGGIELGYKSDLDLVFLYDNHHTSTTVGGKRSIDSEQFYLRLAQKIISIFSLNTQAGVLYDVDMRLRPSGEAGLLVSAISAYESYQQQDAWTWEKQALVRARAVFGDAPLKVRFEHIRKQVLCQMRDVATLRAEVMAMREKMYTHLSHPSKHTFHLKNDPGGITDIEFLAQFLVLAHAPTCPELATWSDNVRIFDDMATYGVLSQQDSEALKTCYTTLRNKIHQLNLQDCPPSVAAEEFSDERATVQRLWKRCFSDESAVNTCKK
ncbi:bifunctional [glutamate--ammonia ligase]-adenylyl-L-tyrosine phosphorylase/[glutamate--ammonia-ligase] adenylyltransferase [Pasteurellaceae bacterium HPA106]|uniref:bifunctional [glutamate--ammonia ligase]-adenylyl-L-tyrosine phosphorylase/[glutamate--ammonia-ligase] adenylyltransferase n=1 Tax=Spirabiliibacterium pneumoniae TaxID=221400 RepID=UPI001AADA5CC|nr:bifunctional [glutamate--ammonia ligase]-adenylyl-L-tyrosine phosphorylase/[glutamate--ammonia-ligase] adenylyltransferase [Spirabiliibacterium pneumoniae]MBE2897121.1 bifunctional [glutamate--ammonia ligase]-adenylyl-L-tyrosine phosphorylase/[glutamate--ammonia-ligase] adenylyltransferase [Spirabiliibacterium pneumoniae]